MYRSLALLEKNIRSGNQEEALEYLDDIISKNYPCKVKLIKQDSDQFELTVNVFYKVTNSPIKCFLSANLGDTFLSIKRKLCAELSGVSPYQQKLIIIDGPVKNISYKFPLNKENLSSYFSSKSDLDLNPICIYITEIGPPDNFKVDDEPVKDRKWQCSLCTYINESDAFNCLSCTSNRI